MIIKTIIKKLELSKNYKPFARVALQFDEYRDGKGNLRWVTGFANKLTWAWEVGMDVQPVIVDEGKYLNFTFGEDTPENRLNVYELPVTVGFLFDMIKRKSERSKPQAPPESSPF